MAARKTPRLRKWLQIPLLLLAVPTIVIAWARVWDTTVELCTPIEQTDSHLSVAFGGRHGFDLSGLTLPPNEVLSGGPPKDGIPALTSPDFLNAHEAGYLAPTDRVIGVTIGGQAKAYPLKILDYHEIVNDEVGGQPVTVTYCPLCDSSVVFDRSTIEGLPMEFGVSGRLYNSNVLMFDRRTDGVESLWSQMASRGVSGPKADQPLPKLPLEVTTWSDWLVRNPKTTVLSNATGHNRNYNRAAYARYFAGDDLMFPVNHVDERLSLKTAVLGVHTGNSAIAYPIAELLNGADEGQRLKQELGGLEFDLALAPEAGSVRVENAPEQLQWCYAFWFAWSAFEPETELWASAKPDGPN